MPTHLSCAAMDGEYARSPSRVSSTPTIAFSPSAAEMPRATRRPPAPLPAAVNDPGTEPEPEVASPVVVVESQEQPPSPCGYQDADDHADDHESKPGSWCIPSETLSRVSSSSAVHDFGQKLDQSIAVQMEILKELKEVKVELQRKRQRSPEGCL